MLNFEKVILPSGEELKHNYLHFIGSVTPVTSIPTTTADSTSTAASTTTTQSTTTTAAITTKGEGNSKEFCLVYGNKLRIKVPLNNLQWELFCKWG